MSEISELGELINLIDFKVFDELAKEETGLALGLYLYFDSVPKNPLTGREFLEFWNSLDLEEKIYYLNPWTRLVVPHRTQLTPAGEALIRSLANELFQAESLQWWERYVD